VFRRAENSCVDLLMHARISMRRYSGRYVQWCSYSRLMTQIKVTL